MTIKVFVIVKKNNKPFKLEIDDQKTILDLKKLIAAHYNETYTGFDIQNGFEIIGNDKNNSTIASCGLNRIVRCPIDYNPGPGTLRTFFIINYKGDHRPFKLNIYDGDSILNLKKLIAAHYNETYTGFFIQKGCEIIGNDKNNSTIASCGLKRIVRCLPDYNPGKIN